MLLMEALCTTIIQYENLDMTWFESIIGQFKDDYDNYWVNEWYSLENGPNENNDDDR
jgi:hypothetical protein